MNATMGGPSARQLAVLYLGHCASPVAMSTVHSLGAPDALVTVHHVMVISLLLCVTVGLKWKFCTAGITSFLVRSLDVSKTAACNCACCYSATTRSSCSAPCLLPAELPTGHHRGILYSSVLPIIRHHRHPPPRRRLSLCA